MRSCTAKEKNAEKRKGETYYSTGESTTTLGDLLKAQGIDLSKFGQN